jgi:hypothetical protein
LTRIVRAPHEIDGDLVTQAAIVRYRELRDWRLRAEAEMDELKDKLAAVMREHEAQELRHDRVVVARLTEYELETIDAAAIKERYPKIYARFTRSTPVSRVDIP